MSPAALRTGIGRIIVEPLRGPSLLFCVLAVWLAGAAYCHGYERLLTGVDEWRGSLVWSAIAVLPWFALFEWSKTRRGRQAMLRWSHLGAALVGTATASLLFEYATNALVGDPRTPILLALMRRLPAIGISLILILWAQAAAITEYEPDPELNALASSIDWLSAADNYVELRIGGRVTMRRMTMREAEKALAACGFVRIHRRYLVNRARIVEVRSNGDKRVRLSNGIELPVGRRFASNIERAGQLATSPQSD